MQLKRAGDSPVHLTAPLGHGSSGATSQPADGCTEQLPAASVPPPELQEVAARPLTPTENHAEEKGGKRERSLSLERNGEADEPARKVVRESLPAADLGQKFSCETASIFLPSSSMVVDQDAAEAETAGDAASEAPSVKVEAHHRPTLELGAIIRSHACTFCFESKPHISVSKLSPGVGTPLFGPYPQSGGYCHRSCALWCPEVVELADRSLDAAAVDGAMVTAAKKKCTACGRAGANLVCYDAKCKATYHPHCAVEAGVAYGQGREVSCPSHAKDLPAPPLAVEVVHTERLTELLGSCLECLRPVASDGLDALMCATCKRPAHLRCLHDEFSLTHENRYVVIYPPTRKMIEQNVKGRMRKNEGRGK